MRGGDIALGPGRVDLLELIGQTGSLRAAAQKMSMSYMRAWMLVKYTNQCFSKPLVVVARGGKTGGGAELTSSGRQIVETYRRMEKDSQRAMRQDWHRLKRFLKV